MAWKKITRNNVHIHSPLAWPLFDINGQLVYRRGTRPAAEHDFAQKLAEGLYQNDEMSDEELERILLGGVSALSHVQQFSARLQKTLLSFYQGNKNEFNFIPSNLANLAKDIMKLNENNIDAILGAVHLDKSGDYFYRHAVDCAIICDIVAKRLDYDKNRRRELCCANLTANVGMLPIAKTIEQQTTPLTLEQRAEIHKHPTRSVELLKYAGIESTTWLKAVEQHHERANGDGYPAALRGNDIIEEARLIALADTYHALINARAYRDKFFPMDALKELLTKGSTDIDQEISKHFIKEIGIPPPGSIVKLACNEIGVVTSRANKLGNYAVMSLIQRDGKPYSVPLARDTGNETYAIRGIYHPKLPIRINFLDVFGAVA